MSVALLDILSKDKFITPAQHQEGVEHFKRTGESPLLYLIQSKAIVEARLVQFLSQKYGIPAINIAKYEIPADVIALIPGDVAKKFNVIPIQKNKTSLVCAVCDPTVLFSLEDLKFRTKLAIEAVLTSFSAIESAIDRYYGSNSGTNFITDAVQIFQQTKEKDSGQDLSIDVAQAIQIEAGAATDKDTPVISLVNQIIVEAIRRGASDIHVESYETRCRVRMRIDGVLFDMITIPNEMRRPLLARIKIMSKLDISETRLPQDGRIKVKIGTNEVDFRVSTMPCLFGEKAVLRILSKQSLQLDLTKLGFESKALDVFRKCIHQSNGIVLVTGPTGSGKTTTLYSALMELNKISDNISTAEDPVEYNLDGVNQVQTNKEIGLTFSHVLRSFLRQDPDIILVGEIRDSETAEIAIQAALTGHLVLSTIHTNDAPGTVVRLTNMGVLPYLVTASVNGIVAQRLLRTICTKCKQPEKIPLPQLVEAGFPEEYAKKAVVYKGKGCAACANSGYKGRVAIYEVMDFSTNLKEMVLANATSIELKKAAVREGMRTLRMASLQKVVDGVTTLEEAVSSTSKD